MDDLQAGRLEQTCLACGLVEAAGAYCSKCLRPMGRQDHYRNNHRQERQARQKAVEIPTTPLKRGRGRPKAI